MTVLSPMPNDDVHAPLRTISVHSPHDIRRPPYVFLSTLALLTFYPSF